MAIDYYVLVGTKSNFRNMLRNLRFPENQINQVVEWLVPAVFVEDVRIPSDTAECYVLKVRSSEGVLPKSALWAMLALFMVLTDDSTAMVAQKFSFYFKGVLGYRGASFKTGLIVNYESIPVYNMALKFMPSVPKESAVTDSDLLAFMFEFNPTWYPDHRVEGEGILCWRFNGARMETAAPTQREAVIKALNEFRSL